MKSKHIHQFIFINMMIDVFWGVNIIENALQ